MIGGLFWYEAPAAFGADLAPDVLGEDRDPGTDHVGLGLAAADLHGEVVHRHGFLDERREAGEGAHVVVDDVVVGERDVGGGDRLAVLPLDALAQMEGPGLAVRGGLPRGGEAWRWLQIERVAGEEVVVEQPDLVRRRFRPDERVEVVGVVGPADVEDHLVAGGRGAWVGRQRRPDARSQTGGQQAGDEQQQEKCAGAGSGRRTATRGASSGPLIRPPRRPQGRRPDRRSPRAVWARPLRPVACHPSMARDGRPGKVPPVTGSPDARFVADSGRRPVRTWPARRARGRQPGRPRSASGRPPPCETAGRRPGLLRVLTSPGR